MEETTPFSRLLKIYRQHRLPFTIGFLLIAAGLTLQSISLITGLSGEEISRFFTVRNTGMVLLGVGFTIIYFYLTVYTMFRRKLKSFSDIDEERKAKGKFYGSGDTEELVSELRSLRTTTGIDYGKIEEIIKKTQPKEGHRSKTESGFDAYFNNVIETYHHVLSIRMKKLLCF